MLTDLLVCVCVACVRVCVSVDISKMARTSSTGTMSSNEDADEKDGNVASFETPSEARAPPGLCPSHLVPAPCLFMTSAPPPLSSSDTNGMEPEMVAPTGPFKNVGRSKAAQTHRMRKLRTPAKCRECDSYVYFQGAECEEVRKVPEGRFRLYLFCCSYPPCVHTALPQTNVSKCVQGSVPISHQH